MVTKLTVWHRNGCEEAKKNHCDSTSMGEDVPKVLDCSLLVESKLVDADGLLENVGAIGLF